MLSTHGPLEKKMLQRGCNLQETETGMLSTFDKNLTKTVFLAHHGSKSQSRVYGLIMGFGPKANIYILFAITQSLRNG